MTTSISTVVPPSSTILSKDVSEAKSAPKSSSNKHANPSSDSTSASHSGPKNNGQRSQFTSSKPNPFRDAFMAKVEKIEYEITNVRSKINDIQAGINEITSGGKSESGSGSLIDELKEKKTRLFALMEAKNKANESMKQIRSEVDIKVKLLSECMTTERSIVDLERRLESGNVKIVDERKLITEISRLKKTHVPYETLQHDIEAFETTLETYRVSRDSAKTQIDALQEEINQIQSALKRLTSQKESKQGQLTELYDKRNELKTKMTSLINEKQVLYDNFKKAQEERRKVYERTMQRKEKQAEKDVIQNDIDALEEKISKLELTADQEVESCDSLVILLNSLFAPEASVEASKTQASEISAATSRKPEAPNDLVLLRREDDTDFLASTSLGKKSSKHQARISKKSASDSSFKLPMNVVSGFGALGVPLPLNVNEVPQAIENLRKKREELSSKSEERKRIIASQKEGITEQINELKLKIAAMDAEIANIK